MNSEKQEYRVLARKYRPQTFAELKGQEVLVQILSNAITSGRIAQAYLLTGVRGIGKTTTARLIAMSLNCDERKSNSCEPCGSCNSCLHIREDRNIDVIEIDAASKTGVEDIREIIDNVKYRPVNSKYKIFIIDEVHMLSKSAFNALLKTLEEPPPHIKFIFATTEIKKIPLTIISRCQRFDLHRLDSTNLISHLNSIAQKEDINIDKDALSLIVRAAEGSVRDGLSLLDQASINQKDKVTADSIISMLGLANRGDIFDLMDAIFQGDTNTALSIYNKLYQSGADVVMIFDEMLNITHFLTQIKISPNIKDNTQIPELERVKGSEIAEKLTISSLGIIWQALFRGLNELQSGIHLFQSGEMLIIRLIHIYSGPSPDDLIKKIESNENFENNDSQKSEIYNQDNAQNTINKLDEKFSKVDQSQLIESQSNHFSIHSFRQLVDLFYQNRESMIHTYLYNNAKLISFKEGEIVLNTDSIKDPHFIRTVGKLTSKWTGRIWQISSSNSNIGKTLYEEDIIHQQEEIKIMQNDNEIKEILNKYSDAKIHSITNINETSDEKTVNEKNKKYKEK